MSDKVQPMNGSQMQAQQADPKNLDLKDVQLNIFIYHRPTD